MILLSEYGGRLFDERRGGDVEHRVSDLVRKLLFPLDMPKLLSFEADLPALAEAAPQALLEVIEDDLRRDESAVLDLMKPVNSGIFGIGRSRARILSALECLGLVFRSIFPGCGNSGATLLPEDRRQSERHTQEHASVPFPVLDAGHRCRYRTTNESTRRPCGPAFLILDGGFHFAWRVVRACTKSFPAATARNGEATGHTPDDRPRSIRTIDLSERHATSA